MSRDFQIGDNVVCQLGQIGTVVALPLSDFSYVMVELWDATQWDIDNEEHYMFFNVKTTLLLSESPWA